MTTKAGLARLTKRDSVFNPARKAPDVRDGVHIKTLDHEEQGVFGDVYAPGFPDSQGDFMSPDEIKEIAYNFLRKGATANIDVNHSPAPSGSYGVESFIARDDDAIFIPGARLIGVKARDPLKRSAFRRMRQSPSLAGRGSGRAAGSSAALLRLIASPLILTFSP